MKKSQVAIQGELGSFSHAAAVRLLPQCQVVPCAHSRQVFEMMASSAVEHAVIPIENSLAGPVTEHYDLLLEHELLVQREISLRIEHHLIGRRGMRLADLRRVFSHPVALQQCRKFFERHPRIQPEPFYDTAGSVKHVVQELARDAAAIAGAPAAQQYGGAILKRNLEDNKQNFTRFFLLTRDNRPPRGANKSSVAFSLKNAPGALFKALSVFALREIDLSKIESRPVPGKPWQYVFYADLLIGDDPRARRALEHLREIAEFVKVLGVYRS